MTDVSLPGGINEQGRIIHISQVNSGATNLQCPYCGGLLTAKKGQVMVHHFAHTKETCLLSTGRNFSELDLPVYDRFTLYMSSSVWESLQDFHYRNLYTSTLLHHNPPLIKKSHHPYRRNNYELTHEGKIPFGEATLEAFSDFQLSAILDRHKQLSQTVSIAYYGNGHHISSAPEQHPPALVDLNLYRAQIERVYSLDLYLLNIETTTGAIQKIGVSLDVERRIKEIGRDLKPFYEVKNIKIDRLLKNRGAVERYAHHRYSAFSITVGTHREYFQLDKKALSNLRRDFTRLGDFSLPEPEDWFEYYAFDDKRRLKRGYEIGAYSCNGLIAQILSRDCSYIETVIIEEEARKAHREATIAGMQAAKDSGIHIGRPKDNAQEIINKYPEIVMALQSGKGVKTIARELSVSKNTVKKVRDAIKTFSTSEES